MVYVSGPRNSVSNFDLLNPFLPKVEITKVSLSFSDRGQPLGVKNAEAIYDRNPHIDIASSVEDGSIAGNLPVRSRVKIANQNDSTTNETLVSIYLTVKMPRANNAFTSLVSQDVVRESINLNISVNDQDNPRQSAILMSLNSEDFNRMISTNSEIPFNIIPFSEFESGVQSSLKSDTHGGRQILGIAAREEVKDNQIIDIYTYRLDITKPDLSNLSILAYASLDLTSLLGDSVPNNLSQGLEMTNMVGEKTMLIALEDGNISSNSVSMLGGKINYNKVYKVQDFRISSEVKSIPLDFSIIENNVYASLKKDLRNQRIDIDLNQSSFSDIYLSRDIDNNCRFYFTIDWKRILIDNSVFGKLIQDAGPIETNLLLEATKILSMKIKRYRIEGSPEIGSSPRNKKFDENEISETVIESKDIDFYAGLRPAVDVNYSGQIQPSRIIERTDQSSILEGFHSRALRTFTGVDGSISAKTDGYYKYEVEIDFVDKSIDVVNHYFDQLRDNINVIENYYRDATVLPFPFDSRTNTFSREFIERYTEQLGGLDGELGTRIKKAIDNEPAARTRFPLFGLVQTLRFFSNRKSGAFNEEKIKNGLLDFVNPNSATPESINILLGLMKSLESKIESILGVVYTNTTNTSTMGGTQRLTIHPKVKNISSANRLCKVSNVSDRSFNTNQHRDLGFDFLGTTSGNFISQGLMSIPSTHITECAIREKNKFFKSDTEDLPAFLFPFWINNEGVGVVDGTYYTPRKIILPGIDKDITSEGSFDTNSVTNLQPLDYLPAVPWSLINRGDLSIEYILNIMSSVSIAMKEAAENNEQRSVLSNHLATYFANFYNAIVVSDSDNSIAGAGNISRSDGGDIYYRGMGATDQIQKAGMYGAFVDFLNTIQSNNSSDELISKIDMKNKSDNVSYYYDIARGTTEKNTIREQLQNLPNDSTRVEFVRQAPVQTKALIYSVDGFSVSPINDSFRSIIDTSDQSQTYDYGAAFQYTTQIINKLEILTGYEVNDDTGNAIVRAPIWEPLIDVVRRQPGNFSSFPLPENKAHLCRISPYVNEKYLVNRDDNYDLPTYDEYFIMEPR